MHVYTMYLYNTPPLTPSHTSYSFSIRNLLPYPRLCVVYAPCVLPIIDTCQVMGAASTLQADKYMALSKQTVTFSGGAWL